MFTALPRRGAFAAALVLSGALPVCVGAQEKSLKNQLDALTTDLGMPATPAAVHVGLSTDNVIQARNRREFEVGLGQLYQGGSQPLGALEFAPYYVVRGGQLNFKEYVENPWVRALTKTTVGWAAGDRTIGESKVSARGYSLSSVLLDLSDPALSLQLQQCIDQVQQQMLQRARAAAASAPAESLLTAPKVAALTEDDEFRDENAVKEYGACKARFHSVERTWNRSRVAVGLVRGNGREQAGARRGIAYGSGAWISAQYGFEDWRTLTRALGGLPIDCLGSPRYSKACVDERSPGALESSLLLTLHARRNRAYSNLDLSVTGELPRLRSSLVGARLTYGSARRNAFVEVSRQTEQSPTARSTTQLRAFGASLQVSNNLWINAISGRRKQFLNDKLESVSGVNLQFGAAGDPLVKPF